MTTPALRPTRRPLGAALALLAACGSEVADAPERPRNVLVVVVDTLRADRLGCYGHERDTSPAIDALAAEGVRFDRAYSTAPWTMPSVASMITGRFPTSHGVTDFDRMSGEVPTLGVILSAEGFRTGAVVSHGLVGTRTAFDRGYDVFSERASALAHAQRGEPHDGLTTELVTADAIETLEEFAAGDAPFYLFVHYFDPHYEYLRHEAFGWAAPRGGRFDGTETIKELRNHLDSMTAEEVAFLEDLYDEEIAFTDRGLAALLARLESLGLDDETLVVFTADHGEEFVTRGWLGHTRTLYDELVRVPLIVRGPGVARGALVEEPVSLVSVSPTVLDLLGIDGAADAVGMQGPSLAPLLDGAPDGDPGTVLFEVEFGLDGRRPAKRANKKGLVADGYKLIRDDDRGTLELYHLASDPRELRDLSAAEPEVTERLAARLAAELERVGAVRFSAEARTLTDEERANLERLGYLDGQD